MNKMKYFELKVVRVEKEKKCPHLISFFKKPAHNKGIECSNCGRVFTLSDILCQHGWKDNGEELIYDNKKQGNWVNGENLDKIKFPCYCSYTEQDGEQTYGELNKTYNEQLQKATYLLSDITHQVGYEDDFKHSVRYEDDLLERLLKIRKIKIRKGKVIIFEEED